MLGRYTTGKDGTVTVTGLVLGSTVVVTETKVPSGYVLNLTPQTITVKNGSNSVSSGTVGGTTNGNPGGRTNVGGGTNGGNDLVFENDPIGTFELINVVEGNKEKRIPNVTFLLYDSTNTPVGQYTSDNSGYVYIENLTVSGRYYLRELENEGYVPDTQMKTVYVTAGETTLIEWKNIPITAQELLCKGWSHHLIHMTAVHLWQNGTLQL